VHWLLVISGFTQHPGRPHGCLRLYKLLDRLRRPGVELRLLTWQYPMRQLAAEMEQIGAHGVVLAGYSYGGWGARQLCRALQGRGIEVERLLLSDPVWRSSCRILWPWHAVHAVLPRIHRLKRPLVFPANVRAVEVFAQDYRAPYASRVVCEGPESFVHTHLVPQTPHEAMDDLTAWHEATLQAAARLLQRTPQ